MSTVKWCEKTAVITLPSTVTLETLPALLKQEKGVLSLPVKQVDFSAVKQADSAILALLLIWSKNTPSPLHVIQLPQTLQNLVALYDLESIVVSARS